MGWCGVVCLCDVCMWSLAVYFWEYLELRNLEHVSLGTLPRGTFCEGFEEILHYGMMRCLSVCLSVIACHLLLGIPRLSKFGKCDPWQILRIYFFQNFKISKIGFLANFFTFFLKNGAVFLWTHVQSWNCGEIMRGCLMKCIFFGRISKISKLDFWRIFLWKSHESLVCILVTSRVYFYIGYIWLVFCWENPLIPPLVVSRSERVYIYGPSLSWF